uniref:Uncharacterized protein n=1 Tax=Oxyrrhis marina TaxID=2969 RepID=A0A7S3XH36_OXYMA
MVRRRDLDFADVLQAVASQHQLFKSESPAQESPVTGDTHDCGCSPYLQPSENVPIAVDQELFHWAQEAMVPDYFVVAEGAPSWEDTVYWNPLAAPFWDDQLEGAVNPVAQLCSADLHEFLPRVFFAREQPCTDCCAGSRLFCLKFPQDGVMPVSKLSSAVRGSEINSISCM